MSDVEKEKINERRKESQLAARHLLPPAKLEEESSIPPEASTSSFIPSASTSTTSITGPSDVILPQLTKFYLKLKISETTVGPIKLGFTYLGVEFSKDNWEGGENLFGKDDTENGTS